MYTGDIASRLQLTDGNVGPVAALTAAAEVGGDTQPTPGTAIVARVEARLGAGLFQVLVGSNSVKLALPADTQPGQNVQLRLAPNGRLVPVDTQTKDGRANATGVPAGNTLTGRVDQQISDGLFKVQVGIRTLQLALPAQTRAGQQVHLQQLANGNWAAVGEAAIDLTNSTQTAVSAGARLVDMLRQAPGAAAAMPRQTPLLPAPPASDSAVQSLPIALARALAGALNESGLFYESHLNQWNAGQLPLAALQREPQAQLQLELHLLPPVTDASNAPLDTLRNSTEQAAIQAAAGNTAANTAASMLQAGVHPDALPVIAQQLVALETGKLMWNGELWAGQNLRWELERAQEEPDQAANDAGTAAAASAEPVWRTRLHLDFPQLGSLSANLILQGNQVSARLFAADPGTREKLTAAGPALAGALGKAGLKVASLVVDPNPDHELAA